MKEGEEGEVVLSRERGVGGGTGGRWRGGKRGRGEEPENVGEGLGGEGKKGGSRHKTMRVGAERVTRVITKRKSEWREREVKTRRPDGTTIQSKRRLSFKPALPSATDPFTSSQKRRSSTHLYNLTSSTLLLIFPNTSLNPSLAASTPASIVFPACPPTLRLIGPRLSAKFCGGGGGGCWEEAEAAEVVEGP